MIQSDKFDSSNMDIKKLSNTALMFVIKRLIEILGICISLFGIFNRRKSSKINSGIW